MNEDSVPYPINEILIRDLSRLYPFTHDYEPVIEMVGADKDRWVCWLNRDDLTVIAVCVDGSQHCQVIDQGWTYLQSVRKVADLVADSIEEGQFQRPPVAQRRIETPKAAGH